ncbi:MAG: M1 family metallopeptidase [Chloroherpetonaceae bacterium]|nr:M1 family metallopeptidase [Chloroherpetonaceae bacterium]
MKKILLFIFLALPIVASAQKWKNTTFDNRFNRSMFRELEEFPTPNEFRNANGAPGKSYWQQKVNYKIDASLDTATHTVTGSEKITYFNNSPDELTYLWLQVDQNLNSLEHSRTYKVQRSPDPANPLPKNPNALRFLFNEPFDGGHKISRVQLINKGKKVNAKTYVAGTVMKVSLLEPLKSGGSVELEIDWSYKVPDQGRGAKEKVKDGWLYEIAQWFPRLCVYDDVSGWQTNQYMGQGEFHLEFGDYDVKLTVPYNHIVAATGVLQNPKDVLTKEQQTRLKDALSSEGPQYIIRPNEVMTPGSRPKSSGTLTWHYKAENVRDFAWVSSKTYVWDAAGYKYDWKNPKEKVIECHSLYPRDASPLWDSVSTKAIIQTMKTYGRMAFEYPYPVAINVHGPVFGMEYPMICFCGARPRPDGTYPTALAHALISVTIHEVGHNWFPMIVSSDERRWTWLDEGVNTFLQYYAELDWDPAYPVRRGPAKMIVPYMKDSDQVPLMTNSDQIHKDFGNNGYSKPAAGLVMLREHILKPDVFDEAFREYCRLWKFKHPEPADFFRSLEKGSGENLAWFWRGWFYSTYNNDQAIADVNLTPSDSLGIKMNRGKYFYRIKVVNNGGLVLPLEMKITYGDGSNELMRFPAEVWMQNELDFVKGLFTDKEITSVALDPEENFADVNRENNTWKKPEQKPQQNP